MEKELASSAAETFGARIRRLMQANGFNQTTLAAKTGIDRADLNRLVNDKREPRVEELGFLAKLLDVTPDELLDGLPVPKRLQRQVVPGVCPRPRDPGRSPATSVNGRGGSQLAAATDEFNDLAEVDAQVKTWFCRVTSPLRLPFRHPGLRTLHGHLPRPRPRTP
ncbi:MAG: helix-turn-helix transcriptional regulator [Deltaproteobacteria bacterium]|nr:helix-turn-helix transcriptional regulator [Deltaproteobacteria bacterium]